MGLGSLMEVTARERSVLKGGGVIDTGPIVVRDGHGAVSRRGLSNQDSDQGRINGG